MSGATLGEDSPVYIPREQLPIPFFNDAVLAVRREDGQIYLNLRDMCESLELAFTAQRRRIFATDRLRAAVARFRVRTLGGRTPKALPCAGLPDPLCAGRVRAAHGITRRAKPRDRRSRRLGSY